LYERAGGVLDVMAVDIRLALTQEPAGVKEVKAKFIGDFVTDDSGIRRQRLMFVRSFETGPERAITANAGDGRPSLAMLKAPGDDSDDAPIPRGGVDAEDYTGTKVGDFRALGGMAMVAYFVQDQKLYRAIHAPVEGQISAIINPARAQLMATDVLFLQFDYW